MYPQSTIIKSEEIDSQDDLLELCKKLSQSERDSFVKYFFYSNNEIQAIKETIDINKDNNKKREWEMNIKHYALTIYPKFFDC